MTDRQIPPNVLRFWASVFDEGKLHDDYADEIAALLNRLADATEFRNILEVAIRRENEETLH